MIELIAPNGNRARDGHALWSGLCSYCRAQTLGTRSNLTRAESCGCVSIGHRKHGKRYTKEWRAWSGIKKRCTVPSDKDYPNYGGSGITLHAAWAESFSAFHDHIGDAPSAEHQVDRIDTLKGYEPGNVRWATRSEQQRNKRSSWRWSIKGVTYESISDAAAAHKVTEHTIARWCVGQFDARRGTFTQPRVDCARSRKYDASV